MTSSVANSKADFKKQKQNQKTQLIIKDNDSRVFSYGHILFVKYNIIIDNYTYDQNYE